MIRLQVETEKPYEILIGSGILKDIAGHVESALGRRGLALVSDDRVAGLYAEKVIGPLSEAGFDVSMIEFPEGEENKTLSSFGEIAEELARRRMKRTDAVIALGGGVTGDMAGFAAASYMRGIRYIQIPTTYLAACDSSVGGKTAVDLPSGKNLLGAFWQPELVIIDYDTFRTLSPSEFLDGSAEALKSAVIGDAELFDHVIAAMDSIDPEEEVQKELSDEFGYVIEHSVKVKRDIVSRDERESGDRKLLNFGHTIGHAVEALSKYTIPHGHAVARGMVCEARAAYRMGLTENDLSGVISDALLRMGFDLDIPYDKEKISDMISHDKKMGESTLTVVVPKETGTAALAEIPVDKIPEYVEQGLAL